jgi:hypothetical protein
LYGRAGIVPVGLCEAVHFDVKLSPPVERVVGDVLVLVAFNVPRFPCYAAGSDFLSDFMNNVVVWLLWGVVGVLEDRNEARFAAASELNSAGGDVVK